VESFAEYLTGRSMNVLSYEWVRNCLGLMPLRMSCSTACWMSDAAWTEWKNYSRPRYDYVAWLPESTHYAVFRSRTLGIVSLFSSAAVRSGMSSQVQKNVQRLRISKSLTCDALSVRLDSTRGSVMRQSRHFDYGYAGYPTFDKTSRQSSRSDSSSQAWTVEPSLPWSDSRSDPIQDMRDMVTLIREGGG
jgi:hypothetical protein